MELFDLKVLGVYTSFYDDQALQVQLPTVDGSRGILAHHEGAVIGIVPGTLRIQRPDGSWLTAVCDSGFARVFDNRVRIMVEEILLPSQIDERAERIAMEKAKDELRQRTSTLEYHRAEALLERTMARLGAIGKP